MADANPVFQSNVEKAFDESIEKLNRGIAFYPSPEILKALKVAFLDGVSFGLDKAVEVVHKDLKGI